MPGAVVAPAYEGEASFEFDPEVAAAEVPFPSGEPMRMEAIPVEPIPVEPIPEAAVLPEEPFVDFTAPPPVAGALEIEEAAHATVPPLGELNLSSATLAELYFNQGFTEQAIGVYKDLLVREPGNAQARVRLTEIEALDRHLKGEEVTQALPPSGAADPRARRRQAIERTIERLEQLRVILRRA
jgi:hypothetical protein